MMDALSSATELLWRAAWGAVPLAIAVAMLCRFLRHRPQARHALWLAVLIWLVLLPWAPAPPIDVQGAATRWLESNPEPSTPIARDDDPMEARLAPTPDSPGRSSMEFAPPAEVAERRPEINRIQQPPAELEDVDGQPAGAVSSAPAGIERAGEVTGSAEEWRNAARNERESCEGMEGGIASAAELPADLKAIAEFEPSRPVEQAEQEAIGPIPTQMEFPAARSESVKGAVSNPDRHAGVQTHVQALPDAPLDPGPQLTTPTAAIPGFAAALPEFHEPAGESGDIGSGVGPEPEDAVEDPGLAGRTQEAEFVPESDRLVAGPERTSSSSSRIPSGAGTARPEAIERSFGRALVAASMAVFNAVSALPALPLRVWLGGSAALAVLLLVRHLWFARVIRRARPAPPAVQSMVKEVASRLGLRRVPRTLVVDDCVSPLVCCGTEPRLVLPWRLWRELDDVARRAILCHELAHIRRGDHWIFWADVTAGLLYWWHPLVWWVRCRLHEEADLCCDAWVTWLMPDARRAYAEALLHTKQFIARGHQPVGLGATTARARRFARRLSMVMTQRIRPGASLSGFALAAMLVGAAWLATPAQSSEPDGARAESAAAERAAIAEVVAAAPAVVPASAGVAAPEREELDERMDRLERRLDRLSEQLERMFEGTGGVGAGRRGLSGAPGLRGRLSPPAPPSPPQPEAAPAPEAPRWEAGQSFGGFYRHGTNREEDGKSIERTYYVSEGKLDALTALMVRSDVPVLVSPASDSITVHGTRRQHETFEAFVMLIDPDGPHARKAGKKRRISQKGMTHPEAPRAPAAVREDVLRQRLHLAEQARQEARHRAAEAREEAQHRAEAAREEAQRRAEEIREEARRRAEEALRRLEETRASGDAAESLREEGDVYRRAIEEYVACARQPEATAEMLDRLRILQDEGRFQELAEHAEKLAAEAQLAGMSPDRMEALERQVESIARGHAERLLARAQQAVDRTARQMEERARRIEDQARMFEERANLVERWAEEIERHAEELFQRAEEEARQGADPSQVDVHVQGLEAAVHELELVAESLVEQTEECLRSIQEELADDHEVAPCDHPEHRP